MASTEETADTQCDTSFTNGDLKCSKLEYSGGSEENLTATENDSIAQDIAHDFAEDLDESVTPAPLAKAVKSDHDQHGFSDDEFPKTLTTLETVKKPAPPPPTEAEEVEICPIEADPEDYFEEEPVLLEVYHNDDGDDTGLDKDTKGHVTSTTTGGSGKQTKQPEESRKERKQKFTVLTSHDSAQEDDGLKIVSEVNEELNVTPMNPIPTHSAGTIEIPRELISSDVDIATPVIINHVKGQSNKVNSDELIAILEGDDNAAINQDELQNYEYTLPNENGDQKLQLSREEERKIAMEQMLNLPVKKKGRPKLDDSVKAARTTKSNKRSRNDLVNALVSDWDENDAKRDDETATEILVEIKVPAPNSKKRKVEVQPIEPTFRRSRIIKKKIIWDPDAPETAINYASLAHTSGAGPIKKPRNVAKKAVKEETLDVKEEILGEPDAIGETIATEVVVLSTSQKKKKSSEIDKLLGDEGAANMLNSLNQGNNNNDKLDRSSPGKLSRAKSQKPEILVQTTTAVVAKAKATKPKETKESTPQKQQQTVNKRNVTPKNVGAGKKRGATAKTSSESWDYIYKSRPDDCMIIRRRSNSSYSSTASLNRNSIDLPSAPPIGDFDGDGELDVEPQTKRSRGNKAFEFAKPTPKTKRAGKSDSEIKTENVDKVFASRKVFEENQVGELPTKLENGSASYSQIALFRFEHFAQIVLQPDQSVSNSETFLSIQMMKEIEGALASLEKDKSCKLVLLTSANSSFCSGTDYSTLTAANEKERLAAANELAKKISNFILALAAFKKPLVAGVKGHVCGLGLRLLPLFDIVLAHVDATFTANSNDFGDIIDGSSIFSTTDKISYNSKAKLLFFNETLDANNAKECNIVTQVLKWKNIDQSILIECEKLATKSSLILETTKQMHQQHILPKLKESLKIEQKTLSQHWIKSDFIEILKTLHT